MPQPPPRELVQITRATHRPWAWVAVTELKLLPCAQCLSLFVSHFLLLFVYKLMQFLQSSTELKRQIDAVKPTILRTETEESWDAIAKALQQFGALYNNGGGDFLDELIPSTRSLTRQITSAMCSERTRLSGVAIDIVSIMASSLGRQFDPLLPLFFPTLLLLCSRTNKVVMNRARLCIGTIIECTQLPAILPYFLQAVKDKSSSLRLTAAEGVLTCMNCFNPPDLEKETRAQEIEAIIRATAKDASADIRKVSKKLFEAYGLLLPSRLGKYVITPLHLEF